MHLTKARCRYTSGTLPSGVRLLAEERACLRFGVEAQLTLGYLANDGSESARFITGEDGIKWWVSGDLVSWTRINELAHRGRDDDVLKIRGKPSSPLS